MGKEYWKSACPHDCPSACSLEVERLSEGQRFTARLMSERPGPAAPPKQESAARVVTPH